MNPAGDGTVSSEMELVELFEQISDRLQAGDQVDLAELQREHPEAAEQIGQLLPAVELLAELGLAASRRESAPAAAHSGNPLPKASSTGEELGVLGDFRILHELGRGGMGIVYEALQLSLDRHVALKVLPFAAVVDPRRLQRFKNEAQAAARLRHPNIVGIHFVGCERSVHFYSMDLVDGESLAETIGRMRRDQAADHSTVDAPTSHALSETSPIAALSTKGPNRASNDFRALANLAIQAAEALDCAHQMGIVHRDIKPSNLLVDANHHLWVTDFGLAMTHTGADLTVSGDLLGTLRYMSPEQASGQRTILDHHTDIYSLGVTLYELATLQPAFPGNDPQRLLREIAEVEPPPPRRLNRDVPEDLETIILKAMAKEPEGRYGTALEMADDLRRFSNHQPITARRPSLWSRGTKWARRNSILLTAVAATLLVCLSVSTLLLWGSRNKTIAALDDVRSEQAKTSQALAQSAANWQLARRTVDDMYTQVAQQWLDEQPHMTQLQREFLTKAAEFYERVPSHQQGDRELRYEAALAQLRAGRIRFHLGQYQQAGRQLEKSVALFAELCRDAPGHQEYPRSLAQALRSRGDVLKQQGKLEPAAQAYLRSIEVLSQATTTNPKDANSQRELIATRISLSQAWAKAGRRAEALPLLHAAVTASSDLADRFPDDLKSQRCAVRAISVLAGIISDKEESEGLLLESIELGEKLAAAYPRNRDVQHRLSRCHCDLARVMWQMKCPDEAIEQLRQSMQGCTELVKNYPDVLAYRMDRIADRMNLASVLCATGRSTEADHAAGQADGEARSLLEDFPGNVSCRKRLVVALLLHSRIRQQTGRVAESRELLYEAVAQCHELAELVGDETEPRVELGPCGCLNEPLLSGYMLPRELANLDLMPVDDLLMMAYSQLFFMSSTDDLEKSLEYIDKIIAIRPKSSGAYSNKATLYRIHGKYDESVRMYAKAIKLSPNDGPLYKGLGVTLIHQRKYKAAVEACSRHIELWPQDPSSYGNRGEVYLRLGRYDDALADLSQALRLSAKDRYVNSTLARLLVTAPSALQDAERALTIAQEVLPSGPDQKAILGAAYYRIGKYEEAKEALLKAAEPADPENPRDETLFVLAMVCSKLGLHEEAQRWFDEALAWMQENAGPEDVHLRRIRDEAEGVVKNP